MSETNPEIDPIDTGDANDQVDRTDGSQAGASGEPDITVSPPASDSGLGDHATGDIVIDSALQDLQNASADDLDAQIEAGRRVHQTLHGRLSDLGGE